MSGNAYNPYNRQQQPQTLGSGYNPQPAYYSPSYGTTSPGGYQPKAYEGGNVGPNVYGSGPQGNQAGRPYQGQAQYQNQPLDTFDGDVHYHPAQNEDFCCSVGCILGFDIVALLVLLLIFISSALKSWGFWFAVAFIAILMGFCIYLLIVACGTNRTNGTKSAFKTYGVLRIITGVLTTLLSIIYFIIALVFWTSSPKSGDKSFDALAGSISSAIGWFFFFYFLLFCSIGVWFLATIAGYGRSVEKNHQYGSSIPY